MKNKKYGEYKEPTYENLPVSCLKLANYQRTPRSEDWKQIADKFDSDILGVILVSYRDDEYWVVDGQHRLRALLLMEMENVMCQVLRGLTYKQEADKFLKLNTKHKMLNANQKFAAAIESGDKMAIDIKTIMNEHGFDYTTNHTAKKNNCIAAVSTCRRIYKSMSPQILSKGLEVIRNAWFGDAASLSIQMLSGMATFMKLYKDQCDFTLLSKALGNCNPRDIELEAIQYAKLISRPTRGDSSCEHIARAIWSTYNKKAKTNKLQYSFTSY